jgi:hypothetical protein
MFFNHLSIFLAKLTEKPKVEETWLFFTPYFEGLISGN